MNVEFINPFLVSTIHTIETMAQLKPVPSRPSVKEGRHTWGVVTGIIGMASDDINGSMVLSFDKPSILAIVSKMLMEEFTEVNQDVVDAVGELTNVISGGAKKELSTTGLTFNMATPVMIVGENIELTQLTKSPVLVIPFEIPQGKFVIEANLSKRR